MEVQFILMTIACAILILTEILQHRRNKRLTKQLEEINEKGFREVMGYGKVYRRRYIFVNIENAGDNGTLNRVADDYYDSGFDLDREKSTDRLLVFVKSEEVKEKFTDSSMGWKSADGSDLPAIDREVIALTTEGKVVFAHRPKESWTGKNIVTGEVTTHYPERYGAGGWNWPDIKWWLDIDFPLRGE